MANRRSGKLWTPGLLKSRGWTKELMAQLLPRPQYRRFNGRSVPHWHRDDVRAAEATAAFQAKSRGALPRGADLQAAAAAAQAAAALLGRAWQDAPREETWPWVLAGYYHQAIVSHLPAAARGRGLRSNQISGFLNQFLSLGTRCDEAQLPGVLTHFVQAGVWLGDHPDAPLAGLVKAQYPGVLRAAAEQVIGSFTAAQPEADLPALLQMKDCPVSQLLSRTLGYLSSVC